MWLVELDERLSLKLFAITQEAKFWQYLFVGVAAAFVYLLPIMLVNFFIRVQDRLVSIKIFLVTIFTWRILSHYTGELIYAFTGFRDRPFASQGMLELFFERPTKAFPSDHAAVLLVVTLALFYYKKPTWGWIFVVGTLLSSFARVTVGFHYIGDILGGWVIGLIGFGVLVAVEKPLTQLLNKIGTFVTSKKNVSIT